jgi:hypothetical protein
MMNDDLKEKIYKLRSLTEEALKAVQDEEYEKLNSCLDRRKSIVDVIVNSGCSKEDLKNDYNSLGISELENELMSTINEKKNKVREEINMSLHAMNASRNYNSGIKKKAVVFSKKV